MVGCYLFISRLFIVNRKKTVRPPRQRITFFNHITNIFAVQDLANISEEIAYYGLSIRTKTDRGLPTVPHLP